MSTIVAALLGAVGGALATHLTTLYRQRREGDSDLRSAARLMSKALRMLMTERGDDERRYLLRELGSSRDVLARELDSGRWDLLASALALVVESPRDLSSAERERRIRILWEAIAMLDAAGYVPPG